MQQYCSFDVGMQQYCSFDVGMHMRINVECIYMHHA